MTVAELVAALQAIDHPTALVVIMDPESNAWHTVDSVDGWNHTTAGPVVELGLDYSKPL